uniref:Uncharacterized protein n=1 Tax=Marseillevirus LCMAC103 TaxID=2506604 RepID=A0A481YX35_9VIRU|nr:MAG: hypothetical protein LCMAC103_04300 [Marseillevirus LCMAC103]
MSGGPAIDAEACNGQCLALCGALDHGSTPDHGFGSYEVGNFATRFYCRSRPCFCVPAPCSNVWFCSGAAPLHTLATVDGGETRLCETCSDRFGRRLETLEEGGACPCCLDAKPVLVKHPAMCGHGVCQDCFVAVCDVAAIPPVTRFGCPRAASPTADFHSFVGSVPGLETLVAAKQLEMYNEVVFEVWTLVAPAQYDCYCEAVDDWHGRQIFLKKLAKHCPFCRARNLQAYCACEHEFDGEAAAEYGSEDDGGEDSADSDERHASPLFEEPRL